MVPEPESSRSTAPLGEVVDMGPPVSIIPWIQPTEQPTEQPPIPSTWWIRWWWCHIHRWWCRWWCNFARSRWKWYPDPTLRWCTLCKWWKCCRYLQFRWWWWIGRIHPSVRQNYYQQWYYPCKRCNSSKWWNRRRWPCGVQLFNQFD